ncbi:MAG: hypothetical protein R6V53_04355 [Candidatus Woesearchaeota archaeon]
MNYKTKSIIIGRKKRENETDEAYPCFVHLFDHNNPHTSGEVPKKMLDFPHTHKVIIKGLDLKYLLEGNDLVVNDLKEVDIEVLEGHVNITGVQVKSD